MRSLDCYILYLSRSNISRLRCQRSSKCCRPPQEDFVVPTQSSAVPIQARAGVRHTKRAQLPVCVAYSFFTVRPLTGVMEVATTYRKIIRQVMHNVVVCQSSVDFHETNGRSRLNWRRSTSTPLYWKNSRRWGCQTLCQTPHSTKTTQQSWESKLLQSGALAVNRNDVSQEQSNAGNKVYLHLQNLEFFTKRTSRKLKVKQYPGLLDQLFYQLTVSVCIRSVAKSNQEKIPHTEQRTQQLNEVSKWSRTSRVTLKFSKTTGGKRKVWMCLVDFYSKWSPSSSAMQTV